VPKYSQVAELVDAVLSKILWYDTNRYT